MNDRLAQFLAAENITQAQFADSINVARPGVSHILAGRNKPGWDFIINTMNRYPTLNIEWLLTGKGKMYKSAAVNGINSGKMESNSLFDRVNSYGESGADGGEVFDSDTVELDESTPQTMVRPTSQGTQQVSQPTPQPVVQQENQRTGLPFSAPQNVSQTAPQTVIKKPNVVKIIVFFDDGTFQECK